MAKLFNITLPAESANLILRARQKATVTYTVSNLSGRRVRGRTMLKPDDPAVKNRWVALSVDGERDYEPSSTFQFSVMVSVPPGAVPGKYTFRLDAVNADIPDEGDHGPAGGLEILADPPHTFPKWIIPIGAVAMLLIAGAITGLLWPKHPATPAPPIPAPSPVPTKQPVPLPTATDAPHAAFVVKTRINPKDNLSYSYIPAGKFMMGCSIDDTECNDNEQPQREVTIAQGFWIGQHEVTQAAYQAVRNTNPSGFKGAGLPVETMNWSDARSYCEAVGMRLPTEAEWEYAARAGSAEARYGAINQIAWYDENSNATTHPVVQKSANAWGLYDMLGNVWEWVNDWYDAAQVHRIVRGGSWYKNSRYSRASAREAVDPAALNYNIGFRCAGD